MRSGRCQRIRETKDEGQVREDHAGSTTKDSLVIGGNFIIEKQLRVVQIDSGAFLGAYQVQVSN